MTQYRREMETKRQRDTGGTHEVITKEGNTSTRWKSEHSE